MKKFLSVILSILMVVTMLPMAVLPASAASEAITLELSSYTKVDYSNSATPYYQYNNYLYKAAYSNLKNISEVAIDYDRYDQLRLHYTESDTGDAAYINLLTSYQGSFAKLSNLPTSSGKSVSFYTSDTTASNEKKPVVTVTCMAVSEPVWSWNGVSSATAVFTSTDGGAIMTVDAAIENSEKTAENCLETDTTAYTATATANGKEYTNVKTIYGEQGPHNFEYIESGDYMIGSCTNGCGMNCTHNWTDKNDYLCDNCGFECHHESYIDGICTVCGLECAHENITDGKCDDCGEDGIVVTITMTDSYSDGWNGNGIVVKQLIDGAYTEVATATFEDGASETFTALLRQDGIYAFSWVYGEYPEECSFTLTVDGETVYECADGGTLADSEIFYIICKHTSYTDGKCDVCDYECPHENQTGSVCEICGEHICSYNNGFCTECDAYQPATLVTNENYESFYLKADYVGYYAISNAGQLFWYANYINTVDRTANAVLTADVDLENRPWTPIGSTGENSNNFRGIFDGQNYFIRGLYVEGDRAGLGFFGEVRTGTVKNFTIYGEVVVNTEVDYVGGVIGSICGVNGENDLERNGAIIQNIRSFVNLTVKAHGVGKIGGFVGYANHESLIEKCSWYGTFDAGEYRVDNGAGGFIGRIQENSSRVTIRNCAAYGTIKTNYAGDYNDTATIYMGGFLSFSNTNAKTVLENCLFAGRFKRGKNLTDEAFLGAFGTLRSVNAIKNCYYLGDDGLEAVHSDSPLKPDSDIVEITKVTGEELKFDMVAAMLGEYWEQGVHYPTLKDHGSHWGSETYSYADNGDGTHDMVCTGCGYVEVYNEAHSGGTATCTEQAKCERCGASYGELNPDNHASDTYTYTDNGDGTHDMVCTGCGDVIVNNENHTLTYTANGNTITAACSANCGYSGTATIGAEGKTYDGNAVEVVVSKTGSLENTIIPVTLTKDGEAFTGEPVNVGSYTASIGMGENENAVVASVEFIIEKANPVIAASPTPNTLTYIGEAQYLISAGEAAGGTMVYSLTENGEYTTSIPQGTNAGDYTVWYYVQGDANRNDSAKASVSVNIAKATVTVTANDATITYGEAPINTGVTYSGFVNGEDETVLGGELAYTYTYTQNGNVGNYSITPEGLTADNYEITFVDGTLTVEQIDIGDIIDEMKINLEQYSYVYDGTEKKPKVTSITVDGVTLTEGTDYTVRYEDNVYVGNYATAVIIFEGNYDGIFRKWFTITKAYYDLTAPTPNTLTYNGEEQYLVSAGTVEGADFEYSLDGVSWSTSIPQAKDAGNYTVYYRVLADENHYGIEGTVDVTIKECPHEWNEGVLTRPERITTTEWDDGYYTYTCTICGEEKTETAKRADYTAFEAVMTDYIDIVNNKSVLDSVKNELSSIYQQNRDVTGGNRIETEQAEVDTVVKLLSDKIDEIKAEIEDGTAVKADYTEIDEAIASVDEALENATISEEMANELSDIKSQLEALKVNENTSMADAAELLERVKAVAETMADCANGIHSFTKYEVTEEAECGKAGKEVAYCNHGCGATDEKEIPALTHEPLAAVVENEVAAECEKAGSYDLAVYCELCGEELDRDTVTVDALTHTDEDGDYLCDHGCGHKFPKPVEPEQPDTPDTPDEPTDDTCDHICHSNNALMKVLWKIISFFYRLFNIQQYCDCGVIHYDAPVFG